MNETKKDIKIVLIIWGIAFFVIGYAYLFGKPIENKNEKNFASKNNILIENQSAKVTETTLATEKPIEYIKCTVDDIMELLNTNALKAEKTYQDQYIEVTGKVAVIDSDGKYISLHPINDKWSIIGIQCTIENDEQLDFVMELSKNDIVTVKVLCDSIGEILGYHGTIIEFVK